MDQTFVELLRPLCSWGAGAGLTYPGISRAMLFPLGTVGSPIQVASNARRCLTLIIIVSF